MPKNVLQYDLLISCPGDIIDEIDIIKDAVFQFNTQFSDVLGISVRIKHWRKNSYAQSGGKPQALLNKQFVNDCDAAVSIFWTRFGTPTDEYESGTEEEVEIMLSSGKQVFMYFSDKPISPSQMDSEGYKKVQEFREKYKDQGIYFTYSSDEDFKTLFLAHLSEYFLSEKKISEIKSARHPELKIVGIDSNQHISDEAPVIKFEFNAEITMSEYLDKIQNLYKKISAINIEKSSDLPETLPLPELSLSMNKPVDICEKDKKLIYFVAQKLNINIVKDFFNLGNLSQNRLSYMVDEASIIGTSTEKDKYYAIQELLDTISKALQWAPIEKGFCDKKCLKLALQNSGTDIDEDIEISLKIPKNSYLPISEFPKFNNDEMDYLLHDCDMSQLFGICSTARYYDYNSSVKVNTGFSSHISTTSILPGFNRDYSDDFKSELAEVFCYSCFDEGEEYILKLNFDYIKHNTIIAFPSIIFIRESFQSLQYTITSKNSPEIVSNEIKITEDV